MVQIRLDIPHLLEHDRAVMIDAGLNGLLQRHGLELEEEATSRLQQAWANCPFHIYVPTASSEETAAQVDAMWPEVANEADFVDFLLMTFLRTFERGSFELVVESRSELVHSYNFSAFRSEKESHAQVWSRWLKSLEDAGATRPVEIASLLAEMFLPLRSAKENMTYGDAWMDTIARRRASAVRTFL